MKALLPKYSTKAVWLLALNATLGGFIFGYNIAVMADWTNSEFGRIRLQYNHEKLDRGSGDNQFLVQYIMSIGAHGAHPY